MFNNNKPNSKYSNTNNYKSYSNNSSPTTISSANFRPNNFVKPNNKFEKKSSKVLSVLSFNRLLREEITKDDKVYEVQGQLVQPRLITTAKFNNFSKKHVTSTQFYASLRDEKEDSRLDIKCFDISAIQVDQSILQEGQLVVIKGKVEYMMKKGVLFFSPISIELVGIGELYKKFQEIRAKLKAEGLLEPSRKKPLPFLPKGVGFITGKDSMGISDVIENVKRRWGNIPFKIAEVRVDGLEPDPDFFVRLNNFDSDANIDVIVIARGGGDPQGMFMFNDEKLARAIAKCNTPIITAIGHDDDHHIVDDVADVSASTPTDVAKHLVPDWNVENDTIQSYRNTFYSLLANKIIYYENELSKFKSKFPSIEAIYEKENATISSFFESCVNIINHTFHHNYYMLDSAISGIEKYKDIILTRETNILNVFQNKIKLLSPEVIWKRGWAIVNKNDSNITSIKNIAVNDKLNIKLIDGEANVNVIDLKKEDRK